MDQQTLDALAESLRLDEQVALLSGVDAWHTAALPDRGVGSIRVTDGPAGARGTLFHVGPPSLNVPCGAALAATFDPGLIEEIGALLGRETLAKGARVLLAPTVNLQRTPIGGRNFEFQSEDPYLSARITASYVRGLQSEGVAACVKHFVGNDTECDRMTVDNHIDEQTLRELYLVPFEAAVTEGRAMSVMSAYNRVNGTYMADSAELIAGVLRGEWGFDGIVMSDWFANHHTVASVEAGMDLEMPGPPRERGAKLIEAVQSGRVDAGAVRESARRMLRFLERVGALDTEGPGPETTRIDPLDRLLLRQAAAASMVLVRNEGGLPLPTSATRRLGVIGPNAEVGRIMGGGSAAVRPIEQAHPLAEIEQRFGAAGVEVVYALGCITDANLPAPLPHLLEGEATVAFWPSPASMRAGDDATLTTELGSFTRFWSDPVTDSLPAETFAARIEFTLVPDRSGTWSFGLSAIGPAVLSVDGEPVADTADAQPGGSFFTWGTHELIGRAELAAGRPYRVIVDNGPDPVAGVRGVRIGVRPPHSDDLIDEAARLAATCDTAILVVGTNEDWESESEDRSTISLPGDQDALISAVAKVCARTIVVVNAGSPVAMPWLDEVDAVLAVWFPGQELGTALVDVLTGDVDPGGRLPVTYPRSLDDSPAAGDPSAYPGVDGVCTYREGRLIGYRWYDTVGVDPLLPFGHGLSYADTVIERASFVDGAVRTTVRNRSDRNGTAVVQVYAHALDAASQPGEPLQRLAGFAKVVVAPGAVTEVTVALDPRWASNWDVDSHAWKVRPGRRELRVGTSSRAIAAILPVEP